MDLHIAQYHRHILSLKHFNKEITGKESFVKIQPGVWLLLRKLADAGTKMCHHSSCFISQEKVLLVNVTYILPNVTVVLSISSAITEHTGYYSCRTEPPNAKSPDFFIQISGKVPMNSDRRDLLKLHFSFIFKFYYRT